MKTSMKRVLLGTTAVVGLGLLIPAPVFAAEPMSLSIDGTVRVELFIVSQDDEAQFTRNHHLELDDGGLNFRAAGEADNGLVYGAKIEVDTDAGGGGVAIDEQMLFFSGSWGRLELGDEDGADNTMYNHGGDLNSGAGGFDGGPGSAFDFNGVSAASPDITGASDATKITYYTPRINGFQLGASYTPDTNAFGAAGLNANVANTSGIKDHFGLGANFVQSFDDVAIRLSAVWSGGDAEALATENTNAWGVGGQVGFGNFNIAAGYGDNGDSGETIGLIDDKEFFDIAVQYSTGPYTVSAGYYTGSASTGVAGQTDDDVNFFAVGAAYSVAPGLSMYAGFDVISVDQNGTGDGVDNDGTLFTIGTAMSF